MLEAAKEAASEASFFGGKSQEIESKTCPYMDSLGTLLSGFGSESTWLQMSDTDQDPDFISKMIPSPPRPPLRQKVLEDQMPNSII